MAVWRLAFHLEFAPSTAGITGYHQRVQDRLAATVAIARTNEATTYSSIVVTSGPPAGRRIWYGGAEGPGAVGHLIFSDSVPAAELASDLFDLAAVPPTFRHPGAILPAADVDATRSFVIYHVCDHDLALPTSCVPVAQWFEP